MKHHSFISSLLYRRVARQGDFPDLTFEIPYERPRSFGQIRDLLAAKGCLCHRPPPGGPDEHRHAVNELSTRSSTFICDDCGGVGTEVYFISFESVHRRLVLEHNQLAVVLEP